MRSSLRARRLTFVFEGVRVVGNSVVALNTRTGVKVRADFLAGCGRINALDAEFESGLAFRGRDLECTGGPVQRASSKIIIIDKRQPGAIYVVIGRDRRNTARHLGRAENQCAAG